MNWAAAIEKNREALEGVLATLIAMVDAFTSPEGRRGASGDGHDAPNVSTLPRHLHRTILRLLRPAEAAVRRLIVVAARGLVVPPSAPSKPRKPRPNPTILRHRSGTGIVMPPAAAPARIPRRLSLPLFDPLPRPLASRGGSACPCSTRCRRRVARRRQAARHAFRFPASASVFRYQCAGSPFPTIQSTPRV